MIQRISLLVWREEDLRVEHPTILTADMTPAVKNVHHLVDAIIKAVTKWMKTTAQGKQAWKHSDGDFNFGEFSDFANDKNLLRCLEEEGVRNLTVEQPHTGDGCYSYDTSLCDGVDVQNHYDKDTAHETESDC